MKTVSMTLEIRTGLPNYSSRTTSVTVVADENESLDIKETVRSLDLEIRAAWNKEQSTRAVEALPAPAVPVDESPQKRGRGRPPKAQTPEPSAPAAQEEKIVEEEFVAVKDNSAIEDILG